MNVKIQKKIIIYVSAVLTFVFTMFPFYWMVSASIKPFKEIFINPSIIPKQISFSFYEQLFEQTIILTHLKNSLWTAIVATIITLILAGMTGYIITRYKILAGEFMAKFTLFTYMVPSIILLLPIYLAMQTLGFNLLAFKFSYKLPNNNITFCNMDDAFLLCNNSTSYGRSGIN